MNIKTVIAKGHARWTRWSHWLDGHTLTAMQLFCVFLCAAVLLIARKPSAFIHAQFYAEDGHIWYAQAYNLGWLHSLALPDAGYLNTLPRIGAGLALLVPFRWAPLMTVVFGLFIQCLPAIILLSARARNWGTLSTRAVFATVYILLPNAREIHIALTNTQWHLSLVVLLLACSARPSTAMEAVGDIVCFVVAGLSGPFSILLTPVLLLYWWLKRQPWTGVLALVTLLCALAETRVILLSHSVRYQGALGPTAGRFLRMVGGDIVSASLFGANVTHGFHKVWDHFVPAASPLASLSLLWLAPLALLGFFLYFSVLRRGPLPLRLLTLYAFLMLAASLRSPLITGTKPLWELLIETTHGRYWFTPMIALLWGAVWCARFSCDRPTRTVARVMLCCLPVGMLLDYFYKPSPNYHFPAEYEVVRNAAPGSRVVFLIPPGDGWDVTLIKRGQVGTVDVH